MLSVTNALAKAEVINSIFLGKVMFANGNFTHRWQLLLVLLSFTFVTQALSAPAELKLENELLLELRLDGEKLGLDVLGYQRGEDFLLSLDELTNGLGFPIAVDGAQGSANGWYISTDRGFSLDVARATVISADKQWPLADGEAVIFQGDVYVETKALQNWFPLRLTAVVRELFLDVETTEPLPIQQRFNRRGRDIIVGSSDYQEPQHPLQDTPYQLIGPHITKVRMGYSTVRQTPDSDAEYEANYATLSRGDLGWMTSTLSLAGQSGESFTGARLKLERTAFDGPLGINHVEVGDVDAGGVRGFLLRGSAGGTVQEGHFDNESVSLEGSQLPDWDVELYQNDQLIMIQTTGQEGRYLFEDIPLLFGENRFELRFFGPYGEIESREEFHFLGVGMLEPGRISYEVAAVQSGRTVFGVNDTDGEGDRDSGIYTGDFNLGLSRNLTVGAGVRSLEINGGRFATSNVGIGLSTSRLYGSVRYFDTPDAQNSISTSLRTQVGDTNLNVGYTQFLDDPVMARSPQKWRTNADISSSVLAVPIKLEVNNQEQEDNTLFDAVLGATKSFSGLGRFSSSLWYGSDEERLNGSTTRTSQTGGQSSFYTAIRPWTFRLSASYGFEPESELLDFSADSSLRIDRDLTLDLSVRQNPTTDTTYYGGGINWQLDQVAINASVNYDSDERWVGLITLSTALVHQPGTLRPRLDSFASVNAGSVGVRVFEDANGTEGEPHSGVGVNGVQAWRKATTDESGVAYLSRMPAHRQVDIEVDESTLADGGLRSKNPGVSIISRPGSYALVEFPLVRTAELEGHVVVVADGGGNNPVSRALVSLKTPDGDVVAQRRTAFDGFYLFDGIEPGIYQVSLEEPLGKRLLNGPGSVTVVSSNGVIRGLDFALRAAPTNTLVLERLVQEGALQQQSIDAPSSPVLGIRTSVVPEVKSQVKE
ncbi:MAG: hypothetical protein ACI9XK_003132 [Granulosicoccus sp.]